MRPMMNDTPSTGKSTLCCNISIRPTQKTKNYLFAWKTFLRLFVVCVLLNMTLPDSQYTGKSTLCHNILTTQQTKNIFCFSIFISLYLGLVGYRRKTYRHGPPDPNLNPLNIIVQCMYNVHTTMLFKDDMINAGAAPG